MGGEGRGEREKWIGGGGGGGEGASVKNEYTGSSQDPVVFELCSDLMINPCYFFFAQLGIPITWNSNSLEALKGSPRKKKCLFGHCLIAKKV